MKGHWNVEGPVLAVLALNLHGIGDDGKGLIQSRRAYFDVVLARGHKLGGQCADTDGNAVDAPFEESREAEV